MSANSIEIKRENLLKKALENKDKKDNAAKEKYDMILAKAQEMFDKKIADAGAKYEEFSSKVEEDTAKRLKIVRKVIDAEAEERLNKEDAIRRKKESEERAAAEKKLAEDAERQRQEAEEKKRQIAEKKERKRKAKEKKLREKVPLPNPGGIVSVANSKKLYAKLKKLNKAGRYSFCLFYHPHEKKFSDFFAECAAKFYDNVAWFDCPINKNNFEAAMLLYEFNATPACIICKEGEPSALHRYVIGDTPDNRATLERYAEKANAE